MLAAASSGHPDSMMIRAERLRLCTALVLLVLVTPRCGESQSQLYPEPELLDMTWRGDGAYRPCFHTEKAALVDIWRSTSGVHWIRSWDLRSDPCIDGWSGVTCDEEGHVIELDLNGNRLLGYLPRSLNHLKYLQRLDVNHNLLTGKLPKGLGDLTGLKFLNLSHNKFIGPIPTAILSRLTNLRLLHMGKNDFDDAVLPAELRSLELVNIFYLFYSDINAPN
eukprot:g1324.t1